MEENAVLPQAFSYEHICLSWLGGIPPKDGVTPPIRLIDSGCRNNCAIDRATLEAEPMWSPRNKLRGKTRRGYLSDLQLVRGSR